MNAFSKKDMYNWCKVSVPELVNHPNLKIPFRLCQDSAEMGRIMARELVDMIQEKNRAGQVFRAIIPCGPTCWYRPFTDLVNQERVSLKNMVVFHMDECLDWQGRLVPEQHPFNFRTYMLTHFYGPIEPELAVPEENRVWLLPGNIDEVVEKINQAPVDLTYGGLGQDGHIAFNQSRRHPFCEISLDELRNSSARVQENNLDTIIALAQRNLGTAYQFVPPMSVTLGVKECLSSGKVRIFSDTGAWKQTALRVALFSPVDAEYPMTLLQEHPDALITATVSTAVHPINENPQWDFGLS